MSWWTPLRGGVDRLRGRSAAAPPTTADPTTADPSPSGPMVQPSAEPTVPTWSGVPPVQRSLREPIEPVAPLDGFTRSLATYRNPSFLAPLSHRVDPGLGGLVDGLAGLTGTPRSYAATSDLTVRPATSQQPTAQRAAVQRAWGSFVSAPEVEVVRMEHPDIADADHVRQVTDAGLTGSGSPAAPVGMAEPLAAAPGGTPVPVVAQRVVSAEAAAGEAQAPAGSVSPGSDPVSRLDLAPGPTPIVEPVTGPPPIVEPVTGPTPIVEPVTGPTPIVDPVTGPPRSTPGLPAPSRQLLAVADLPVRRAEQRPTPTLELPVLRLVEPPAAPSAARVGSRRSATNAPAATEPPVAGERTSEAAETQPDLGSAPRTDPQPVTSAPPSAIDPAPSPDAPLSGFAAAIAALNAPEQASGATETAELGERISPAGARPAVQRSTDDGSAVDRDPLSEDPVASSPTVLVATELPTEPRPAAADVAGASPWSDLPRLRVRAEAPPRPALPTLPTVATPSTEPPAGSSAPGSSAPRSTNKPILSRSVAQPGSNPSPLPTPPTESNIAPSRLPTPGELPVTAQPAAVIPSAGLLGSQPALVQRDELSSTSAALPTAVQPLRFVGPEHTDLPGPQSAPVAAAQPAAQLLSAGGPIPTPAGPVLPAANPAGPAAPLSAPPRAGSYPRPAGEPAVPAPVIFTAPTGAEPARTESPVTESVTSPTSLAGNAPTDLPSSGPAPADSEPTPAAAAYEVVQLSAIDSDRGRGPSNQPPVFAPSVQRRVMPPGPAVAPVTVAPPSRIVQRTSASASPVPAGPVHSSAHSAGPVSFASMFAGLGETAGEDGYTSVQLTPEDGSPPGAAEPTVAREVAAPDTSAEAPAVAVGPSAAAPSGAAPADLDEMARRLFEPLTARIKAELWMDRERSGLMTDVRP